MNDEKLELEILRWLRFGNSIANRVKWIVSYYFIIVVRDIKIRLASEDYQEFEKNLRKHKRIHVVLFVIFIVC